jgi:hypothetical protein
MLDLGGVEVTEFVVQGIAFPIPEAVAVLCTLILGIFAALMMPMVVLTAVIIECVRCQPANNLWCS